MLFHKRTRNAIKYIWGAFSIVIILSMIFAYSGFALLARTAAQPPQDTIDVTTPVVTRDNADSSTTGAVELVLPEEGTQTPATPPTSSLDFSL